MGAGFFVDVRTGMGDDASQHLSKTRMHQAEVVSGKTSGRLLEYADLASRG
jgi:hypothetical protein